MKVFATLLVWITLIAVGLLAGCTSTVTSVDASKSVRRALDAAGLKVVTVKHDHVKGVVTLGGHVASETDKAQAEMLAKQLAPGQVVAVEIAVTPPGLEKDAKAILSDLDDGIEKNLHAALIAARMQDFVKYEVKNAVVTLAGEVNSQERRAMAESIAMGVPYVKQVVNTLQVKNQKATSTN